MHSVLNSEVMTVSDLWMPQVHRGTEATIPREGCRGGAEQVEWACAVGTGRASLRRTGLGVDVFLAVYGTEIVQTERLLYACPAVGSGFSGLGNSRCLDAAGEGSVRKA